MSLFKQLAKVKAAQIDAIASRSALSTPAGALLARGYRHPLTTVGSAAGAGFVLGIFGVGPLRVPGLSTLLSGGVARAVAYGTQIVAEMTAAYSTGPDAAAADRAASDAANDTAAAANARPNDDFRVL